MTSPSEQAGLVAMKSAGATDNEVCKQLNRSWGWVSRHKEKMAAEIAEHRKMILEDAEEDYTDVISLSLYRMREQLFKNKTAKEIPARDLAQVHKTVFTARQLMRKEPPDIPSLVSDAEPNSKKLVDRIAIADEFNKNFEHLQRAAINAMSVDAEEGDFVDCPPD